MTRCDYVIRRRQFNLLVVHVKFLANVCKIVLNP